MKNNNPFQKEIFAIQALLENEQRELNQTQIRSALQVQGFSDTRIRQAIGALEVTKKILFRTGNKGAKFYRLA